MADIDRQWIAASVAAARWINVSSGDAPAIRAAIGLAVQRLGKLDVQLRARELGVPQKFVASSSIDWITTLDAIAVLSDLWVLAAYEVVRTLTGRPYVDSGSGIARCLNTLKAKLTRVRIPLAKLIGERQHLRDGPLLGYGTICAGMAWRASDGAVFVRAELADEFLAAFAPAQ